jgi:hypothetical protein
MGSEFGRVRADRQPVEQMNEEGAALPWVS